jgi:hypothetical protein
MEKDIEDYMLSLTDEEVEEIFEIIKFGHKKEDESN